MSFDFFKLLRPLPEPPDHVAMRIRAAGLCCAVGYHLRAADCALRAHMDHFQESEFRSHDGGPLLVARLPETELWGQPRLARWLELALADCLDDAPGLDTRQVPLIWLAPEAERAGPDLEWRAEIHRQAVTQLGKEFHPASGILPLGRAGLAHALQQACACLLREHCPAVLLAGVDSYLDAGAIMAICTPNGSRCREIRMDSFLGKGLPPSCWNRPSPGGRAYASPATGRAKKPGGRMAAYPAGRRD